MNNRQNLLASALLAILGVSSAGAMAASDARPPMEIVRSVQHGHAYQNGGIGKDEVQDMDQHLKRYNLRMSFSEGKSDAFVTGVRLRIVDAASGKRVFDLGDAGPMTDVALPAGQYRVEARFGKVARTGTATVAKDGAPATLNLHWPKDET